VSVTAKRATFLGATTVALLAGAVLGAAPAFASNDSSMARSYGCPDDFGNPARVSASGYFSWNGDLFELYDDCADGHSVTLFADVAPFVPNNGYDFLFRLGDGRGSHLSRSHNITEGTSVTLRVCSTEGTTPVACSTWVSGVA
jgi:hypothetical protein